MSKKGATLILCILLLVIGQPLTGSAQEEPLDLLILNSYPPNGIGLNLVNELIDQLDQEPNNNRYHIEYLFNNHSGVGGETDYLKDSLRTKYDGAGIDLVVAIGYDAFSFIDVEVMQQYKDIAFFVGSIDYELAVLEDEENRSKVPYIYGNWTNFGIEKHINMMKNVQPQIEKIYIFCDNHRGKYTCDKQYSDSAVEIEYIHLQEIGGLNKTAIDQNPKGYSMLLPDIGYNAEGNHVNPIEYVQRIEQYYSGPIYFIDKGIYQYAIDQATDSHQLMGGLMRDRVKEVDLLGMQINTFIASGVVDQRRFKQLEGVSSLNWNSVDYYGLNIKRLSAVYPLEYREKTDFIIPKSWLITNSIMIISVLGISIVILLLLIYRIKSLTKGLKKDNAEYDLLLSILPEGLVEVENGRFVYSNLYAAKLCGEDDPTAGEGKLVEEMVSFEGKSDEGGYWCGDIVAANGVMIHCAVQRIYSYEEHGRSAYLITDLAQQKVLREKRYYRQIRKEVFAHLSHDIRTPVNVILSALQIMNRQGKKDYPTEEQGYFLVLRKNSYQLLRLVNSWIDLIKLEDGKLTVNLNMYNIVQVSEEMVEQVIPVAEKKGITVIFDPEEEEIYAQVDREKYERCLLKLLAKELKGEPSGGKLFVHIQAQQNVVHVTISSMEGQQLNCSSDGKSIVDHENVESQYINSVASESELLLVNGIIKLHGGNIRIMGNDAGQHQVEIFLFRDNTPDVEEEAIVQWEINNQQISVELSELVD